MSSVVTYADKDKPRHPLGLPPGSVRAVLALMIAALFWTIALLPEKKNIQIPLFLYFLLVPIAMFFFAHGRTIAMNSPSPWGLPRGTFRVLILLITAGGIGLHYYLYDHGPWARFEPPSAELAAWPKLLLAMALGLALGRLIGQGPWRNSAAFQDIQAWVSLLGMLGLGIEFILHVLVRPQLADDLKGMDLSTLEAALTGIVAWYFAARS
ncbi:MAG TPA: hypothetical protein VGZ47_08020 [Gemmataceae bacterium]|jgi:hypothetical protein|nr:hypothetical protein [Gemmataceae bacterium]